MSIIGGLMQAQGQIQAGDAAGDAYDFNANVSDQNAEQAIKLSAQDERRQRIHGRKAVGEMRASYGASGVTAEGSPSDVLAESMASAELDALNIRYAGESRAANFRNEATIARFNSSNARSGARMGAAATIIGSAINTGAQYMTMFGGSGGGGSTSAPSIRGGGSKMGQYAFAE